MIIYLIKSALCMVLLLGAYHLFLEREKMHQFNRAYLLLALFLAVAAPLMPFGITQGWFVIGESSGVMATQATDLAANATVTGNIQAKSDTSLLVPFTFPASALLLIYITGVLILLLRFLISYKSLIVSVRRNRHVLFGNSILVLMKERTGPFSFLKYIFLNEQDYTNGKIGREILIHEQAHIRQRHSWDILAAETVRIFFWFNPLFYYLKRAMQLNHEFIADQAVIEKTGSRSRYQKILFNSLQPAETTTLASSFNFSLTKKRFQMMNRKPSNSDTLFKQTVAVTILFTAMILFGVQADAQERKIISLEIGTSEVLKLNGNEIHFAHLEQMLSSYENPEGYIVSLKVHANAFFGLVTDVQRILRKTDLRRVNYSSNRSELSDPETEALIEMQVAEARFIQQAEAYMRIPADTHSLSELQTEYDKMMEQYNRLIEKQSALLRINPDIVPPPPPLPPNPEYRTNNKKQEPSS